VQPIAFEDYVSKLGPISIAAGADAAEAADIQRAAASIQALPEVTRDSLSELVSSDSEVVRALALCVGMSGEGLKGFLRHRFGTASHRQAARKDAAGLVVAFDEDFDLVGVVSAERERAWTFADVLVARALSRSRATAGMGRGRFVEDAVEAIAAGLGLPHEMRTRFVGRDARTAPCDLAIPAGGADAMIVCGAKGFDSTGSKLTDAVGEIRAMADTRLPAQYVFAVVDGIGWQRRQSDLRRIHELRERNLIDGLYTLSMLDEFGADLVEAAQRRGLL
jgi:hypothetical protein